MKVASKRLVERARDNLAERDSHNAPMTPLPESTAAGGHGSEREKKGFGTFASP